MVRAILVLSLIMLSSINVFASYEEALKLFEEGNYSASLNVIAAELDPDNDFVANSPNYNLRFLAAHNHWKLGNDRAVISHFNRCMEIRRDSIDPHIDLALFYLERGRFADAEAVCRRGFEIKQSPMLYYIIGRTHLARHNFRRARDNFERANSLDPEFYLSYNGLGIALMHLGRIGEANFAFRIASTLRPQNSQVLNNLGVSYEALGNRQSAVAAFERALRLDPNNVEIRNNLSGLKN